MCRVRLRPCLCKFVLKNKKFVEIYRISSKSINSSIHPSVVVAILELLVMSI